MGVTVCELHQLHGAQPLTSSLQFSLPLLKLIAHCISDLLLELGVNFRDKELIKVSPAHRAGHSSCHNLFVTLEAHEMLAWRDHRLCAELKADGTLVLRTTPGTH